MSNLDIVRALILFASFGLLMVAFPVIIRWFVVRRKEEWDE